MVLGDHGRLTRGRALQGQQEGAGQMECWASCDRQRGQWEQGLGGNRVWSVWETSSGFHLARGGRVCGAGEREPSYKISHLGAMHHLKSTGSSVLRTFLI